MTNWADHLQKITKEYSERLFNWALGKTQNHLESEDLTQEVLCQVFLSLSKGARVESLENYIWRTAHYVWCNRLRTVTREREFVVFTNRVETPYQGLSVLDRVILDEELRAMRLHLANLSRLKREIMVAYYLDEMSVEEVARKLQITPSAVKWHLFDGRRQLKEEMNRMKDHASYVYQPGRLTVAYSGNCPGLSDTVKFRDSLTKQNLALLCYHSLRTLEELVETTGIPRPYLEPDLEWLVEREFMKREKGRFLTTFVIWGHDHHQTLGGIYQSTRGEFIDLVLLGLKDREKQIRQLGFHGSDWPFSRILWPLLMLFPNALFGFSPAVNGLVQGLQRPLRPDGGRYFPLGLDQSEGQAIDPEGYQIPQGWGGLNGSMTTLNGDITWLGVPEILGDLEWEILFRNEDLCRRWYYLFTELIKTQKPKWTPDQEEMLAKAIEHRWVVRQGERLLPQFVIFERDQWNRLFEEIYRPMVESLEPVIERLLQEFYALNRRKLPPQIQELDFPVFMDFFTSLLYLLIFAWEDGLLEVPQDAEEQRLTNLVMVYDR